MSFFEAILGLFSPAKSARPAAARRRTHGSFVPSDVAEAPAAVILVADLDGDAAGTETARIDELLAEHEELKVSRSAKKLKLSGQGGLLEKLTAAAETGRRQLAAAGADILVWGEMSEAGDGVTLRFLPAASDVDGKPGSFGLGNTLELPAGFSGPLADVLHATVLAAVGPLKAGSRQRLCTALEAVLERVNGLVETLPAGLDQDRETSVLTCLGNAFAALWRLSAGEGRLERAIQAYSAAIEKITLPHERPLIWALTQNHLAAAFEALAERDKDPAPFDAAAAAYRSVANILDRSAHANDWALAHTRLGMALYRQAAITFRAATLQDAVEAFNTSLTVYTRGAMPGRWAEVTNQLGVVYLALGEQVGGTKALEQSVAAFRSALELRGRDATPLLWAQTANNLGAAAFSLAKRNNETGLLNEARSCFEDAIEVYSKHGRTKIVAVIKKNLHRVRRLLETR